MPTTETSDTTFRRVFTAHFDAVTRYCLRRIAVEEVNDVVADVFAVAWKKIDRMPADSALPWLYGIARNELRNRYRAGRRFEDIKTRLRGQASQVDPGPEPQIVRRAELQQVMDVLETLAPADREILLLRTQEELDYSQLGALLGCSAEAARKRLNRAIARLRTAGGFSAPPEDARGPCDERRWPVNDTQLLQSLSEAKQTPQ